MSRRTAVYFDIQFGAVFSINLLTLERLNTIIHSANQNSGFKYINHNNLP